MRYNRQLFHDARMLYSTGKLQESSLSTFTTRTAEKKV
jgi:hypothetical protein